MVMIASSAASSQQSQIVQTNPLFTSRLVGDTNSSTANSPANAFQEKVTISPEARREINDTASPEKDNDEPDNSAALDVKDDMNITSTSADSMSSEKSNSSSFMPSRQMVLDAYAQNS